MTHEKMNEYRKKLGEFFYPFLANVELKNISAVENTESLIDAFIAFNANGYFAQPHLDDDVEKNTDSNELLEFSKTIGKAYRLE